MIKIILFDCDGPIVKRDKYFSQRLMDLGIKLDNAKIADFFNNEFLLCETGKADLKEELAKRIKTWGWEKSLDELLDFWFSGEAKIDLQMIESIKQLRQKGIECFLVTDQEKYRAEYLWKILGLEKVLDGIYPSYKVGFLKRNVEFWEHVYKNFNQYSKEEILVWDDEKEIINVAKEFGFNAELYTDFADFKISMKNIYTTMLIKT